MNTFYCIRIIVAMYKVNTKACRFSRTCLGAGEPLLKSVSINLVPNQIIDIQMYSGGLLLLSQSNSTCVVMLGSYQSNRGEFLSSYEGVYKLFVKDTPDKINIYADSTGWHIQNSKSSNMTVVYRLIQIKSRWD